MGSSGATGTVPDDFADRVKSLRRQLALTVGGGQELSHFGGGN